MNQKHPLRNALKKRKKKRKTLLRGFTSLFFFEELQKKLKFRVLKWRGNQTNPLIFVAFSSVLILFFYKKHPKRGFLQIKNREWRSQERKKNRGEAEVFYSFEATTREIFGQKTEIEVCF